MIISPRKFAQDVLIESGESGEGSQGLSSFQSYG